LRHAVEIDEGRYKESAATDTYQAGDSANGYPKRQRTCDHHSAHSVLRRKEALSAFSNNCPFAAVVLFAAACGCLSRAFLQTDGKFCVRG
jgi:hypothetical protein